MTSNRKYLINFETNPKDTAYFKTNILQQEEMPFDGATMSFTLVDPMYGNISGPNNFFTSTSWDWSMANSIVNDLITTKFSKFRHNFLSSKVAPSTAFNQPPVDWFDPEFSAVIQHFAVAAAICAHSGGNMKGLFFDAEPNVGQAGWKIWTYSDRPHTSQYTLAQYRAQVYKCGYQIMEAMQNEVPSGLKFLATFTYYQLEKANGPTTYQMYGDFLDGLFDACSGDTEIHDMCEDGYGHYTTTQFNEDIDLVMYPTTAFGTTRFYQHVRKGNLIWLDYVNAGQGFPTFNTGNNLLNYFTAARFQTALETMFPNVNSDNLPTVDTYTGIYSETVNWLSTSPTVPTVYIAATNAARATLGWQKSYDPTNLQNLAAYFDPFTMALPNNTTIATYTGKAGEVWAQASGSAQPIYKTSGINSLPAVLFASASSQYLTCTSFASKFSGTINGTHYLPCTIVCLCLPIAGGVQGSMVTMGSGTSALQQIVQAAAGHWHAQKVDDVGGSVSINTTAVPAASPTIITLMSNGTTASVRVNGNRDTAGTAQAFQEELMTITTVALGANFVANAVNFFFNGYLGPVAIFNSALGLDQVQYVERGIAAQYGITLIGG